LIEVFSRQNYGHREQFLGGLFLFVKGRRNFNFGQIEHHQTM
jgi:hypothetical protein